MATATPEPRYPLALTERQLRALTGYLDTVSTSEADPDAEVFALIDQVRQVRKLIATSAIAPMIQNEQDTPDAFDQTRAADLQALGAAIDELDAAPNLDALWSQERAIRDRLLNAWSSLLSDEEHDDWLDKLKAATRRREREL